MVSILPSARTGMDVLGQYIGQGMTNAMPQMYENQKVQRGVGAFNTAEKELEAAGNDPYKIAMILARAGIQAPGMERALGPLMQTAMQRGQVNRAFGDNGQGAGGEQPVAKSPMPMGGEEAPISNMPTPQAQPKSAPIPQIPGMKNVPENMISKPNSALPNPFNILTAPQMEAESERFARALNDPNQASVRLNQLQSLNNAAETQRNNLQSAAESAGISAKDMPRFMLTGRNFDPSNPSQWLQDSLNAFKQVKSNDTKLERAFIPGVGNALLGKDRDKALDKLGPIVRDQMKLGLEDQTREFLADNYLTPTEIEKEFRPVSETQIKNIQKLPRSFFPYDKKLPEKYLGDKSPFIPYEDALEKAPDVLQKQTQDLASFFMENLDEDSSLLALREKILDRDYDWQQIGPAIRTAMEHGLKLSPRQSTEMANIESQPPYDSLGDIFQDWDRFTKYFRGNK